MSDPMTPPPVPGQKKKMSALGWIAIGCGAIAILGIIAATMAVGGIAWFAKKQVDKFEENPAVAAAELAIRANPDVELVASDVEKGTITYRDKKTGEEITVNAEGFKDGEFTVTTKDGTATFDASQTADGGTLKVTTDKGEETVFGATAGAPKDLPSWLPVYAGGAVEGAYNATTAEGRSAMFTVTTSDSVDQVAAFYKSQLEAGGLTVEQSSFEGAGQRTVMLVGKDEGDKRNVNVTIAPGDGKTQAVVSYNEKN